MQYIILLDMKKVRMVQDKKRNNINHVFPESWCLSIHVGITQLPHERVRTDHLLDSHPYRELGISITKLVNIDGDNIGVIVKLYEALKSLSLESCLHLYQSFLLYLLNSLLNSTFVTDSCSEHTESSVLDILW